MYCIVSTFGGCANVGGGALTLTHPFSISEPFILVASQVYRGAIGYPSRITSEQKVSVLDGCGFLQ